jgi:hypothetical protein
MTSIDSTLAERGSRYGIFAVHAEHTQAIKSLLIKLMGELKWACLHADQKEALEMIAHKLGRITNGDPNYDDSWRDIAGYAQLVANRLASQVVAENTTDSTAGPEPTPQFKVGDRVRIAKEVDRNKYTATYVGFNPAMEKCLGQTGIIHDFGRNDKSAMVKTDGCIGWYWLLEDLSLEPAKAEEPEPESEGSAVHVILLDDNDPDVDAIQRMLAGFLRGTDR